MSQYFLRRNRRMIVDEQATGIDLSIDPVVTNWSKTAVANFASAPSTNTLNALNVFYKGLVSYNLLNKMLLVNCIAPSDVLVASTPLVDVFRNSRVWSGNATLSGSNGIYNSSGFTDTSFIPGKDFPDASSAGITLYGYNVHNIASSYDFGMTDFAGANMFAAKLNDGGVTSFFIFDSTNGKISGSFQGNGYYSANRTSATDLRMFFANSSTPHNQFGTISTGTQAGILSNLNYYHSYLGATYITSNGTSFGSTTNVYSFVAMHLGLTQSESNTLFNLVQQMRTSLGGGYV